MPYEIPAIDPQRLRLLLKRIKPVVKRDGDLWYIKDVDPVTVAFTWSPTLRKKAVGLEPFATIQTLHRYAYYGFFKPSLEEVMAFMPDDALENGVVAFSTQGPGTADDLNKHGGAVDAGFHVAETTLYRRAPKQEGPEV